MHLGKRIATACVKAAWKPSGSTRSLSILLFPAACLAPEHVWVCGDLLLTVDSGQAAPSCRSAPQTEQSPRCKTKRQLDLGCSVIMGMGCSERLWSLCPWGYSKYDWAACCSSSSLGRELGLGGIESPPPTSAGLWPGPASCKKHLWDTRGDQAGCWQCQKPSISWRCSARMEPAPSHLLPPAPGLCLGPCCWPRAVLGQIPDEMLVAVTSEKKRCKVKGISLRSSPSPAYTVNWVYLGLFFAGEASWLRAVLSVLLIFLTFQKSRATSERLPGSSSWLRLLPGIAGNCCLTQTRTVLGSANNLHM